MIVDRESRNVGIDMAKVLAMLLVIVLHTINLGGLESIDGVSKYIAISYKALSIGCVDIFAIISGFLCVRSRCAIKSYLKLYLQVFTIGLMLFATNRLFTNSDLSVSLAILPLWSDSYWYFTAYTGLFIVMPLLNYGLLHIDRSVAIRIAIGILVITFYACVAEKDIFVLSRGYSFVWLSLLYLLGGLLRLFPIQISGCRSLLISFAFCVLSYTVYIISMCEPVLSYVSPFIVASAVFAVHGFSVLKFDGGHSMKRTLAILSSVSFGVYLIHVSPFVFSGIFGRGVRIVFQNAAGHPFLLLVEIPLFAIGVYLLCGIIEYCRARVVDMMFSVIRGAKR